MDGTHAFYHDVESGGLTRAIEAALKDRGRLLAMSKKAKAHVLKHHTLAATARYLAESTLAHANVATEMRSD
jgi:hypothetical protein